MKPGGSATTLADAFLRRSPAQVVSRWMHGRALAVLAYHGIDDPENFARQLEHLRRHYHPIAPDDFVSAIENDTRLPARSVLVTFDDGEPTLLERGLPVLQDYRIPGVAFVVAGMVDTDTPYWWVEAEYLHRHGARLDDLPAATAAELVRTLKTLPDRERLEAIARLRESTEAPPLRRRQLTTPDLARLEAAGIEIGSHSLTHPLLDRCDDEKVATEIEESHRRLTDMLGHPPRLFAYPNGNVDRRAELALRALGYAAAFSFDHRLCPLPVPDPMRVSRLRVGTTGSVDRFAIIVSGLHPALHRMRGRS